MTLSCTAPSIRQSRIAFSAGVAAVAVSLSNVALAVNPGLTENFSAGLAGWGGGSSPTLVSTGGPSGAGDAFLRISSTAGSGNGNLAALNTGANWIGNYAGNIAIPGESLILGAEADLANFGTAALSIRAIFFNTANNRYSTLDVATVPADGVWRHYVWNFDSLTGAGLTTVAGSVPIATGMHDVTQIMFRHNIAPAAGGDAVTGSLGIDNIHLIPFVPAPSSAALLALSGVLATRRRR